MPVRYLNHYPWQKLNDSLLTLFFVEYAPRKAVQSYLGFAVQRYMLLLGFPNFRGTGPTTLSDIRMRKISSEQKKKIQTFGREGKKKYLCRQKTITTMRRIKQLMLSIFSLILFTPQTIRGETIEIDSIYYHINP